jgi:hypothetical protein
VKRLLWASGIIAALLLAILLTGAADPQNRDSAETFLGAGNAAFRMGEAAENTEQKIQYFMQALQTYREGIEKYPRDMPLKYNYEAARERIEALEEQQKETERQSGDGNEGEQNEEPNEERGEEQQPSAQDRDESAGDREAIERILESLMSREEEDLKNNQKMIGGKEDPYGW